MTQKYLAGKVLIFWWVSSFLPSLLEKVGWARKRR
jgi:hypothetical protein